MVIAWLIYLLMIRCFDRVKELVLRPQRFVEERSVNERKREWIFGYRCLFSHEILQTTHTNYCVILYIVLLLDVLIS